MITKSITFSKTYELLTAGGSVWQKISVDGEVEEGENPYEAIEKAKEIVEESHKKYLPEPPMQQSNGDIYFNVSTQKEER